jgi:hypothetical protein
VLTARSQSGQLGPCFLRRFAAVLGAASRRSDGLG